MDIELINQIDNEIYGIEGNVPIEVEGKYSIFIFTKYNSSQNERWEIPDLLGDWSHLGTSWIGSWYENQYYGSGPIDIVYQNEMTIRARLNEYKSRGVILDFRIRYNYPRYISNM